LLVSIVKEREEEIKMRKGEGKKGGITSPNSFSSSGARSKEEM